jgi:hypothetical protein
MVIERSVAVTVDCRMGHPSRLGIAKVRQATSKAVTLSLDDNPLADFK